MHTNYTNRKILVGILIILATAVVLFGGAYVWLSQTNPKSLPTRQAGEILNSKQTQNSNSETAGWKTYTNTELGFEIKYPANWLHTAPPANFNNSYVWGFNFYNPADPLTPEITLGGQRDDTAGKNYIAFDKKSGYYFYLTNNSDTTNQQIYKEMLSTFKLTK